MELLILEMVGFFIVVMGIDISNGRQTQSFQKKQVLNISRQ